MVAQRHGTVLPAVIVSAGAAAAPAYGGSFPTFGRTPLTVAVVLAEQVQGAGMVGVLFQDAAIKRLGLRQLPFLV